MFLAWPALGARLSLGRTRWAVGLGCALGALLLVAGWGVYVLLWIVALAGFAA